MILFDLSCRHFTRVRISLFIFLQGNNVIVKTAEELGESSGQVGREGSQQNAQIEKHHKALNEESVVSLTDILEAASQDEMIGR